MKKQLLKKGFRIAPAAAFSAGIILALTACSGPLKAEYRAILPQLPQAWAEIIGTPHWRFQWVNENGVWEIRDISPANGDFPLSPPEEWAVPILAWPYWPERSLTPGCMRPAGAIYPWDASGENITLSWQGGVDAYFWQELASGVLPGSSKTSGTPRLPWLFDWPRFRELLQSSEISEAVRKDPWTADWSSIAQKTIASGFDKRRIKSRSSTEISVPSLAVSWIGTSPFMSSIFAAPDEALRLPAYDEAETWISIKGIIRCNKDAWIFVP